MDKKQGNNSTKKCQKSTGITLIFTHKGVKMIKPQGFYRGLRLVRAQNHLCPWVARTWAKKRTKSRRKIVQKNRRFRTGFTLIFHHRRVKMIKPQGFYRGLRIARAPNHLCPCGFGQKGQKEDEKQAKNSQNVETRIPGGFTTFSVTNGSK